MRKRPKREVFILDTSAFLQPKPVEGFTVREVAEEVKSPLARSRLEVSRVRFLEPSSSALRKVRAVARNTGDKLSESDLKLLALAVDMRKEGNVKILTDDYAIQNLGRVLGLNFESLGPPGIKEVFKWISVCRSCDREYPPSRKECVICGSKLERKPKSVRN